jgi:catechol-2,3-dioxygenase
VIPVKRLNHAVLYVRELDRAVEFYREAFGFEEIAREGGQMAFLRAADSSNHHDLGLLAVGANAPRPPRGSTGLYHLAWEVAAIEDAAAELASLNALTGQSDHGATKSLYGADPDGNEFEVMWMVPREEWGEYDRRGIIAPLDMTREVARHGRSGG